MTNQKNGLVLLTGHALFPLDLLYLFTIVTVTAYTLAIVIGTLTSRALVKSHSGMVNGGAESVEPCAGDVRARGSRSGGKEKISEDGKENETPWKGILGG